MVPIKIKAERRDRLRVYLNDHLAGAAGGIRLAMRCRGNNPGTPLGVFLDGFLAELEEDYQTLRGLMERLDLPVARPKQLAVASLEWVGRFKLNGQLTGYSPLSRLVELEGLAAGVDTKRSLWLSLHEVQEADPVIAELDLPALVSRAEQQREALEMHRQAAAGDALA